MASQRNFARLQLARKYKLYCKRLQVTEYYFNTMVITGRRFDLSNIQLQEVTITLLLLITKTNDINLWYLLILTTPFEIFCFISTCVSS